MTTTTNPKEYKICVKGTTGVGKSSLILRLINGTFIEEFDPTIEDSYRKTISIDNKTVILDILEKIDDEYESLRDSYIIGCNNFILMYDITSNKSFNKIIEYYSQIIRVKENKLQQIVVILVGNKSDLETYRQVRSVNGQEVVNKWRNNEMISCHFYEMSVKEKINHLECFYQIVRVQREKLARKENEENNKNEPNASKCCVVI